MGGLLVGGGAKGMLAPLLKLLGGPGPPAPPLPTPMKGNVVSEPMIVRLRKEFAP